MSRLIEMMVDYYSIKITDTKAMILQQDFSRFDEELLIAAWGNYRQKDLYNKMPTIAQLVENFPDGRPSAHDAWAMIPRDEMISTFWTEEMRIAYGLVYQTMNAEKANAWFSFKEKYDQLVREARMQLAPVKWSPSFGRDLAGRSAAIKEAVEKGRIPLDYARDRFPELTEAIKINENQIEGKNKLRLGEVLKLAQTKKEELE